MVPAEQGQQRSTELLSAQHHQLHREPGQARGPLPGGTVPGSLDAGGGLLLKGTLEHCIECMVMIYSIINVLL